MTKTHNNNKNHHKKKIIIKNDISNNYLFNDIQNKNIKSRCTHLYGLDNQKRKVSFNSNNLNNLNKKKLNIIKNPIFMNNPKNYDYNLDDIIKKIKEELKIMQKKNYINLY